MNKGVFQGTRECRYEDFAFGVVAQSGPKSTDEDAGIRPDRGLRIHLHFCEKAKEVIVEESVCELWKSVISG